MTTEDSQYIKINVLNNEMNYWFIRTNGGNWYNEFVAEGHCTIVDPNINLKKLNELKTYEEVHKELTRLNDLKIKNIEENALENNLTEKEKADLIKEKTHSKRSITIEASRIYNFVHGIKENDLIMIPYKSSRKYKIGYVISKAKEYSNEDLYSIENRSYIYDSKRNIRKYQVSKNKLYRDVEWIKTIERKDVDAEILNHLNMHQAIANLNQFKFQLNNMIAPIYIQNDNLHINIKVNREKGIDNDLWLEFHKVVNNIEKVSDYKISEMKLDVQSPGVIETVAFINELDIQAIFNGGISQVKDKGWIILLYLFIETFGKKEISKFMGFEFVEKEPKELKEARNKKLIASEKLELLKIEKEYEKLQNESNVENIAEKIVSKIED
ncbi:hypothetical protein [Macrococcoides caseolyticum]|uniref:Uncharacterized protein n=1 Tax=Macrococcoides caseolyticum TaxID=69966 RepID=A0ACC9MW41_9STAP|nr:hypothetical protein [Macrococcus caseolyticus]PKE57526.1 hypothetical protein CW682_00225 [Macrococcus caseolyticus]